MLLSLNSHYEHLVNKMDGPDFYRRVVALVDIGHDALPAVQAGMGYSNWRVRRGCAAVLYHLYDTESLRRLVLLTRDPKKKVRKMALLSLGRDRRVEGEKPIDVVPHLSYSALNDPAVRVRRVAVVILGVQPPQRRVVRLLRKILSTERDPKAIRVAKWGLARHQNLLVKRS
jgi:HEAT repeat protein